MRNTEIEFKYSAADLSLIKFRKFCIKRGPIKSIDVTGVDHFFSHTDERDSFYRHRLSPSDNQLTFKRKTNTTNYIRIEHNIDLAPSVSEQAVKDLVALSGYRYNSTIVKNSFVYLFDYYSLVYYICYTEDMKELGRFIEIEMKEDYDWTSEEDAFGELVTLERLCNSLGTSAKTRISESLFELYRKE